MKKTKVFLREKKISKGRVSLYLDFYPAIINPDTGKETRREFLKLYALEKPRTITERDEKREVIALAEGIRAKRQLMIRDEDAGFLSRGKDPDFIELFEDMAGKRNGTTRRGWRSSILHFKAFAGDELPLSRLNREFCNEFRDYLLTARNRDTGNTLSVNAANSYLSKFKAALRELYRNEITQNDLSITIEPIRKKATHRTYLTLDELKKLAGTHCQHTQVRNMSLFAALTGLRFSDIVKLKWSEVHQEGGETSLKFHQQKTEELTTLPISNEAAGLLGDRQDLDTTVFKKITPFTVNRYLRAWVTSAGIDKDITFHCLRHTYAVMQLSEGTDIYTVSKMMGHTDLATTQVYADIVSAKKREAAERITIGI